MLAKFILLYYTLFVDKEDILFQVNTPLGVAIRTTTKYWQIIVEHKHPSVAKHKKDVKDALRNPDEVRKSKKDVRVHLYYKNIGNIYVCAVADHINEREGYIITAYLTDRIKEGEKIYEKN